MRRVNGALVKRLLQSADVNCTSLGLGMTAAEAEAQVIKQAGLSRRAFSRSPLASSAATEARVNSVPPYVTYGAVGLACAGGLAWYISGQPKDSSLSATAINTAAAEIPADKDCYPQFHCQDHMGMHYTQDDLLGDFAVLFFGSVDHAGRRERLLQMAEAVMESDRQSNMHYLRPVFATLKPDVDDVIKLNSMVEDYATALNRKDILHVRLKAITGNDTNKLHEAAQKYTTNVKARSNASEGKSVTKDDQSDLYFVNPEGEFIASYGPDAAPKTIGREWAEIIKAYKLSHPSWHGPKAVKQRHA